MDRSSVNLVPVSDTAQSRGKIHRLRAALAVVAAVLLPACAAAPPPLVAPPAGSGARPAHVVLISIDGLRPDAIEAAGARTLLTLMRDGAWTHEARTVLPSRTLPSHTSMLTGVPPEVHGITWNDDRVAQTGLVGVPTVFDILEAEGLETAAFTGKAKFRHLLRPGAPSTASVPRGGRLHMSPEVTADVLHHLRYHKPHFLFVHLSDPDVAGHALGWMGPVYRSAVRRADAAVGHVVAAARRAYGDDVVVIVTSDHGGEGRGHGAGREPDVRIPWIAWGRGVAPGRLPDGIRTTDTAATVLWLLGVAVPAAWEGEPLAVIPGTGSPALGSP
jgi:arylsulfatase A-like enzyme